MKTEAKPVVDGGQSRMNVARLQEWWLAADSKSKARTIAASAIGFCVIFYGLAQGFNFVRSWQSNQAVAAVPTPGAAVPVSRPVHQPYQPARPTVDPSVAAEMQRLKQERDAARLRNQVLGSGSQPPVITVSGFGSTSPVEPPPSRPTPEPTIRLSGVSYIGWYDHKNRSGQDLGRERIELKFTEFNPDSRKVAVEMSALDHLDWGVIQLSGTMEPPQGSSVRITVKKQNAGSRELYTGFADLFGTSLHFQGRFSIFNMTISGNNITGQCEDGHTSKLEKITLTRVRSSDVKRPSGPDPEGFKKEDDKPASRSESASTGVMTKRTNAKARGIRFVSH